MKNFPKAMCTQHPDSASRYISTQAEVEEAIECFAKYNCDEYMPDYEGKTTPYHQNLQIVAELLEKTDMIPAVDVHITPRVPSASHENRFRQLMVMMSIAEANALSREHLDVQAIEEFVHPMTSGSEELIEAQKHAVDITNLAKKEFNLHIEPPVIIPLLESVESLLKAKETILSCFNKIELDRESFRVFFGKSDAALFSGHVSSALACKFAIHELRELGDEISFRLGIILGAGALPFRGHVTFSNAKNLFSEYRGIDTITIQSALRYDHPPGDAEKFIKAIDFHGQPEYRNEDEKQEILQIIRIMEKEYREVIPGMAGIINMISGLLPNQRDRLIANGAVGYARKAGDDKVRLPRAIKFTGALYSIGIPPEFIGTGRGLAVLKKKLGDAAFERLLENYYPSLESDLRFAHRFLDIEVAKDFLPYRAFELIQEDIMSLSDIFNFNDSLEPEYSILMDMVKPHLRYLVKTGSSKTCGESAKIASSALLKMAVIRKSLG
ncbi:MAG: phosphoenolpyruvate carboxylase [Candidatus Methanoperedens sp.]|nr:phosphoenolpyruvate carboxylase [Candidatus Methanoperedens sp.]